jgi:hypothetical protein
MASDFHDRNFQATTGDTCVSTASQYCKPCAFSQSWKQPKQAANSSCATLALPPIGRVSAGKLPSGKSPATECLVHVKSDA